MSTQHPASVRSLSVAQTDAQSRFACRVIRLAAAAALIFTVAAPEIHGSSYYYWSTPSGNWTLPSNWAARAHDTI